MNIRASNSRLALLACAALLALGSGSAMAQDSAAPAPAVADSAPAPAVATDTPPAAAVDMGAVSAPAAAPAAAPVFAPPPAPASNAAFLSDLARRQMEIQRLTLDVKQRQLEQQMAEIQAKLSDLDTTANNAASQDDTLAKALATDPMVLAVKGAGDRLTARMRLGNGAEMTVGPGSEIPGSGKVVSVGRDGVTVKKNNGRRARYGFFDGGAAAAAAQLASNEAAPTLGLPDGSMPAAPAPLAPPTP